MARSNRFALSLLPVLLAAAASAACGDSSRSSSDSQSPGDQGSRNGGTVGAPSPGIETAPSNGSAQRAIAEADIVQINDGRLYAMSKSGTLSIVDVSKPGRLVMLGQAYLPGEPFEMYLRGDLLVAMTNGAYAISGQPNEPSRTGNAESGESRTSGAPATAIDTTTGAGVIVINVKDPGLLQRVATFPVAGEIADSRVVGDILYLATYETSSCYRCGSNPRTMVTSFDIASPLAMRQVDQATFENGSQHGAAWGTAWKRSIVVTPERMYVGGHGDLAPSYNGTGEEGVIDVLDVTDPTGKLGKGAHITTTGAILSRWQMDEKDGVLRVVSQRGMGYANNGVGMPEVQTFNIWNTRSLQAMGKTGLRLPRQEALKTVRFDGERAYAITYARTDPLFVIDLADPASPKQRGELVMPGYVFHLEPHGDRLLGLGLDRNDSKGNLNVSLFDVADMDHPTMLQRVSFGSTRRSNEQGIATLEMPEDQDRIQKAFRVLGDGLIVAPYSGAPTTNANGFYECATAGGGVQLIDWTQDTLTKQATLPVAGNPRRAIPNNGELLAISDSNVTAFDLGRRDVPLKTADLVIGSCELRSNPASNPGNFGMDRGGWAGDSMGDDYYGGHCSLSATGVHGRGSLWAGLALGVAAIGGAVRRRRQAA